MRLYSIGEVCYKFGGVSRERILLLERKGAISPRRVGRRGDRLYTPEDLDKIRELINEEAVKKEA
ncbi:MAG: MerR family transcriptional regulator [Planctomycetota bacterium]|jgi:DNA-binding transcriptional MerR regulator